MDNADNLEIGATLGIPAADQLANALKGFAGSIRHKAQLKQGLEIVRSGNLNDLNGGMLDRLIESNINPSFYINSPVYQKRIIDQPLFAAAMQPRLAAFGLNGSGQVITNKDSAGENIVPTKGESIKKYIPVIIGLILAGVLIYYVSKK
jgi:hypothetical protein